MSIDKIKYLQPLKIYNPRQIKCIQEFKGNIANLEGTIFMLVVYTIQLSRAFQPREKCRIMKSCSRLNILNSFLLVILKVVFVKYINVIILK